MAGRRLARPRAARCRRRATARPRRPRGPGVVLRHLARRAAAGARRLCRTRHRARPGRGARGPARHAWPRAVAGRSAELAAASRVDAHARPAVLADARRELRPRVAARADTGADADTDTDTDTGVDAGADADTDNRTHIGADATPRSPGDATPRSDGAGVGVGTAWSTGGDGAAGRFAVADRAAPTRPVRHPGAHGCGVAALVRRQPCRHRRRPGPRPSRAGVASAGLGGPGAAHHSGAVLMTALPVATRHCAPVPRTGAWKEPRLPGDPAVPRAAGDPAMLAKDGSS